MENVLFQRSVFLPLLVMYNKELKLTSAKAAHLAEKTALPDKVAATTTTKNG